MKQKYLILNNDDQKELIIREFADLEDKELLLLLGEEKYDVKAIKSAINNREEGTNFRIESRKIIFSGFSC